MLLKYYSGSRVFDLKIGLFCFVFDNFNRQISQAPQLYVVCNTNKCDTKLLLIKI